MIIRPNPVIRKIPCLSDDIVALYTSKVPASPRNNTPIPLITSRVPCSEISG